MKKSFLMAAAVIAGVGTAAAETPLWLRNPALSPDGNTLAFTYKGDIYTVGVGGGSARQITANDAYDTAPVWAPDGKSIAFASDRDGSTDIFLIPAEGGTAKRLTTSSNNETPVAFLNDSTILYTTSSMGDAKTLIGPFTQQVYAVSVKGGRPRLFKDVPVSSLNVGKDGRILYQDRKGYEDVLRKHERSSSTADVWLLDGNKYTKITDFNGHDQSPVWIDADNMAYISEKDGILNVYSRNLTTGAEKQLTAFKNHPVRTLSRGANGLLAFSWNGELYTLKPGEQPVKVNVNIVSDDYDSDRVKQLRTSGATTIAPSPDGKQVAFVLRGDVYVTSTKYKTTRRITNTSGQERSVEWSPDGKQLVYDSERDGLWQLFTAKAKDSKQALCYADDIVEESLYKSDKPAQWPEFSPDGKKVAFLEDRTILQVLDLKSKKVVTALPGEFNYSYSDGDVSFSWAPDSRWLLADYIGVGGWNNTDIALVKADGSQVVNLTESGYSNGGAHFAMGGRAVTYTTGKYGLRSHGSWGEQSDVEVMVLDGDAWDEFNRTEEEAALAKEAKEEAEKAEKDAKDKKKDSKKKDKKKKDDDKKKDDVKPLDFDLANRNYRVRRITGTSTSLGSYRLNNDGTKLYYIDYSRTEGPALMERNLRKGETKVLASNVRGGFVPDKKMENIYVLSGSGISKISLSDGKKESVEFEAEYDRKPSLEREYIYEHMLRQVADKFHDTNLHGADWNLHGENYRRFLPHINNNYDFALMLSEILGELNASHTGGRYYADGAKMSTAVLGAFFDQTSTEPGLKVEEVIARGPLADKKAGVKAGDVITAIDGAEILADTDVDALLEGKVGRNVRLTVRHNDGKTNDVKVKPISAGAQRGLLYQRWVERNEAVVDSLSGGRIGYVHIQGMDSPSFRAVYSKLLGKYRNREAVVVDTRWNGGGWLHNDVALLLSGKEYVRYTPRGRYVGSDPFSQWTKPSVMLVNEANYSDAHGTPYVYQTLKIGDVVGAPVPGTMTAVWWETQIDPTLVFGIPQVTSLDVHGEPLENKQLNPDVEVYNNPADVTNGRDAQLEASVRTLLEKLAKK